MGFPIRRVAVLGSGVMGSGIAAHLANAGIESYLFDIVPKDAAASPAARNAISAKAIAGLEKTKPPQLFRTNFSSLITPANYEDHGALLAGCDWIVEVVVERLDIKQKIFAWVEENRRPGTIVSSNTSGIPLSAMSATMGEEMRKHFLITHFFNPVRYMRLLEFVTGADTLPEVTAAMAAFGQDVLGKGIVYGKDTPAFIANRIGTFGIASVFRAMGKYNLGVSAVDAIFGDAMGRASSAICRTADVVGLDTLTHVSRGLYDALVHDEEREAFAIPDFLSSLVQSGRLGSKTGAGFYKKVGKDILELDLATLDYKASEKPRFPCVGKAKKAESVAEKLQAMVWGAEDDLASTVAWKCTAETLIYAANRIPEIADDIVNVDNAMKWGFGWELGPFETWDAIGVRRSVDRMKAEGMAVPAWIDAMLASGRESFFGRSDSADLEYAQRNGGTAPVPTSPNHIKLADLRAKNKLVEKNISASLFDIGDGAALLEFHTKMNSLDEGIFDMYSRALDKLDAGEFATLVVGNEAGKAFSAGANVLMILMGANQGAWAELDSSVNRLQQLLQRAKFSKAPVITAPHALTLGGGAEVAMQSTATVAQGDLFMGLVEAGVGLIPGGGGCKEMIVRYLGEMQDGIDLDPNPFVHRVFQLIGLASVTSSAEEARAWGFLRKHDRVVLDADARIATAKKLGLGLAAAGYVPPRPVTIPAAGANCRGGIALSLQGMLEGGFATPHDLVVGNKLAWVLTGGDVPAGTRLTEQQLLDLEREAFLSLCGEEKSRERMQHMLMTGKPLRN